MFLYIRKMSLQRSVGFALFLYICKTSLRGSNIFCLPLVFSMSKKGALHKALNSEKGGSSSLFFALPIALHCPKSLYIALHRSTSMPGFDDAAIDARLRGEVDGEDHMVYQLLAENEAVLRGAIEETAWYNINVRIRPDTCENAKQRILEEARRACQTYANQPWLQGGVVVDEAEIVWILKWCYKLRGSLDAQPRLGLKTCFLSSAGARLSEGLSQRQVIVAKDVCTEFVKRVWDKATGHRAAYDAKKNQGVKRAREELNEAKARLFLLENRPHHGAAQHRNQLDDVLQLQNLPGIEEEAAEAGGEAAEAGGRAAARGRGARGRGAARGAARGR